MTRTIMLAALALAACGKPAPEAMPATSAATTSANTSATPAVTPATSLTGHWVGVEGMYLDITAKDAGKFALEMQYDLDHKQTVVGTASGNGIAFDRDGKPLTLTPSDGDVTGLKYLAGKKDCLTVAPGEGYCRD